MDTHFTPILLKLYIFKKYTLLFLHSGQGLFQVDFRNYTFTASKAIFLSPGQYFQLLSGQFSITLYEFPNENIGQLKNSRFLFKHLVSLGHIDINNAEQFNVSPLNYISLSEKNNALLSSAIKEWIQLNPFNANAEDINLLFDLKEIIDRQFMEPMDLNSLSKQLHEKPYRVKLLTQEKLNHTIHKLVADKVLLETKRKIIFSDLSSKEIAYQTGFKDPAYFNRFFKQHTSLTPLEFKEKYEFDERDTLIKDLLSLINERYKEQHTVEYYAGKLNTTAKSLSQKVNKKLGHSAKQLIIDVLLYNANKLLRQQLPIHVIAFELGFREPNHFTTFYKLHTGKSPSLVSGNF